MPFFGSLNGALASKFQPGEVRVVILDAQPIHQQRQEYRLVDAATGEFERGYCDVDDMATTTWADWSAAAEAAYQDLAGRTERVVVAGLSMGGSLTIWLAGHHPEIAGIVTRVGDETVGEMWSLYDGQDVLNEVDPTFSENIRRHVERAVREDPFHVSANTDPKGDRSKRPQDQDPDMLLHVVRETDRGIVVRGAKYETAAAYANQAFVKPTIANWGDDQLSDYAVGFIVEMGQPGLKHICRTGFTGRENRSLKIGTMSR